MCIPSLWEAFSANGARCNSLGQRPRLTVGIVATALKARNMECSEGFISHNPDGPFADIVIDYQCSTELNKAFENREYSLRFIRLDPSVDSLRDDPRFKELLRRMRLPERRDL